ncbi:MAG: DUF370 domain-containing protein [Ruminococcaceae bacterium]|nr:DUF370 domain-containing protein [Oscillospiraceae bacterium]
MFLHLGNDCVVPVRNIIGIFDIENTSISKDTKAFLSAVSKKNEVVYVTNELPKSFVVCKEGEKQTAYISQISVQTLKKRLNGKFQEFPL